MRVNHSCLIMIAPRIILDCIANVACSYSHTAYNLCCLSAADFVPAKPERKTRGSVFLKVPSSDVQSSSRCTCYHRTRTGPIRKARSKSRLRRMRITSLTLADHDASQSTLEDYNFIRYPRTTPVSTYPSYAVTPNKKEQIQSLPSSSGVSVQLHYLVACTIWYQVSEILFNLGNQ